MEGLKSRGHDTMDLKYSSLLQLMFEVVCSAGDAKSLSCELNRAPQNQRECLASVA